LVSNWLHDNIVIGSEVTLSGPIGNFTYVDNPAPKLLMISAGSGITPMMSMLRWLYDTVDNRDIVFVHSARSPQDVIFRQELELIAARRTNFRLVITTTRLEPGQIWLGFTGRLSEAVLQTITPDLHERQVYVCGPESFMQEVKAMFKSLNFPMQNYYEESFGLGKKSKKLSQLKAQAPLNEVATQKVQSFGLSAILSSLQLPTSRVEQLRNGYPVTQKLISSASNSSSTSTYSQPVIVFAESGKEVTSDGEESILEVAEQEGIKIRSSCRMGSCGTCKKLKTEGQIRMERYDPEALDNNELEAGYILSCIAYPLGRVVMNA
jgi:ferredoxin-NADP reductase